MQAALPDEGGVELCVHKHHHLKGHGDAQAADAGHRRLQPEQTWGVGETREREINTLSGNGGWGQCCQIGTDFPSNLPTLAAGRCSQC